MSGDAALPAVVWLHDPIDTTVSDYIVRGLIEPESLAVMYGESGCGKSTLAVSLGMAIARGDLWRERPTRRGLVFHIAGEGVRGLRLRQKAHAQHYEIPRTAPYAVLPAAVDFNAEMERQLVATVLEAASAIGEAPSLVVVDTLARCLRGDENTSADMGRFIAICDQMRTETEACVLVLHHVGKDSAKGARGHSSLRAAADTELLVEGATNPRVLQVKKQRDLELAEPMGFRLEPVVLGESDGQPITACVVVHDETAAVAKPKAAGRNQASALTALKEWCRTNAGADCIDSAAISGLLHTQGIGRKRRPEVLNYLCNARVLTPAVGGYALDRGML
jgi:hypothetical protein